MVVLNQRVVITKGNVARQSPVHIPDTTGSNTSQPVNIRPRPNAPLQRVWWTPLANLPALAKFGFIGVGRAPINPSTSDWNDCFVTVRNGRDGAAKIAIQVYAVVAETDPRNVTTTLNAGDVFRLYTNAGASTPVTFTLPNATQALRGAELFFQNRSDGNDLVIRAAPSAGGGDVADVIEVGANDRTTATASGANEKLVISWAGPDRWRVTDQTAGWTFA